MDDVINAVVPIAPSASIAGYYTATSTAGFSYCEEAYIGTAEVFSGTTWTNTYADLATAPNNCWYD